MQDFVNLTSEKELQELMEGETTVKIEFPLSLQNALDAGEIVFFTLEDGYGTIELRKSYGLAKPKMTTNICPFGEPRQTFKKKATEAKDLFLDMQKVGNKFFFVPGMKVTK